MRGVRLYPTPAQTVKLGPAGCQASPERPALPVQQTCSMATASESSSSSPLTRPDMRKSPPCASMCFKGSMICNLQAMHDRQQVGWAVCSSQLPEQGGAHQRSRPIHPRGHVGGRQAWCCPIGRDLLGGLPALEASQA